MLGRRFLLLSLFLLACLQGWETRWSLAQSRLTKESDKQPDSSIREQTIYIPYAKLREIFEREGRGVFLPYDKFQELWNAAQDKLPKPAERKPPVGALIAEIENEATVERDVVSVTAKLKVELIAEGWHSLPIRLNDVALRSAKIGNRAARVTFDPQNGHQLLVEQQGKEAELTEVELQYSKAFAKSPGINSVSLQPPTAPVNRWRVRIPQTGVKINVEPLIAATEGPADPNVDTSKETTLLAFVGAAPEVRIDWTPKAEGAAGLEALTNVQSQQEVVIEEGSIRNRLRLSYAISRAELTQLSLEIPADHKVTGVFDSNIRQWDVKVANGVQTVTVQLFEPARAKQDLVVELEKLGDELFQQKVSIPTVKAVGAGRQQGIVVVALGNELRAEIAQRRGVLQLDLAELPPNLTSGTWAFAFRYATPAFDIALQVEKVLPLVRGEELVTVFLEPEKIDAYFLATFEIERAGVFQLEFNLPNEFEFRSVRGHNTEGATAAAIESHQIEGDAEKKLRVNLTRKTLGKIGVLIELQRRLNDPNLLSPTGNRSSFPLSLPRIVNESVERRAGRLIIYGRESLLLNPTKSDGLSTITHEEAARAALSAQLSSIYPAERKSSAAMTTELAYAYSQQPIDFVLEVERRRHQITARQLLVARVETGVIKYQAKFNYDILYSGVKSLRIDVPTALASRINVQPTSVRKAAIEPAPGDVAQDYVAWNLSGGTEFLGAVQFQFEWEHEIQELEVGKSLSVPVPVFEPRGVDRAWGQVVVVKAETLDVAPADGHTGLRPIDPQYDLIPGANISDAALAFEFHDTWGLKINATRYKQEETKRTSIDRSVIRAISTMSGQVSVQALYRVRSALQRLSVKLPVDNQLDTDPFKINGRPVPLERGTSDDFLIPLTGQTPDQPFLLELRYTIPGNGAKLEYPLFPESSDTGGGAAVQKVFLCAYLPQKQVLVGTTGPWEDEVSNAWFAQLGAVPAVRHSDTKLVTWVREGITLPNNPMQTFPTQGKLHVFSTLRPPALPQGTLHLRTYDNRLLYGAVYGALGLIGLVFARTRVPTKFAVLGTLLVGLLLVGVFLPTLAMQTINGTLFAGLGAIVGVWSIFSLNHAWTEMWRRGASVALPAAQTGELNPPTTRPEVVFEQVQPTSDTGDSGPTRAGDPSSEGGEPHGIN